MTDRRYIVEVRLCSDKRAQEIQEIFREQIVYLLRKQALTDDLIGLFVKNDDTGEELSKVITKESLKN